MPMLDFFEDFLGGIEFLIAFGSILGLLGLIVGIIFLIWGSSRMRGRMIGVIVASFVLLVICGPTTGLYYFRIFR